MSQPKSKSQKGLVVEYLYDQVYLAQGRSVITLDEVSEAIKRCNEMHGLDLSLNNPANFMKDLVRSKNAALYWPERLKHARIDGRQRVGDGRALEFVPYAADQQEAFESSLKMTGGLSPTAVQSISIPLTARSLGRTDESWLIQVAVTLRIIETHFATRERETPLRVIEIVHLQTGVKLSKSELDAVFLATVERDDGALATALVTCEAKQANERISDHQIVGQVIAAHRSVKARGVKIDLLIPIAIQAVREPAGSIYVAECEEWTAAEAELDEDERKGLVLVSEGLYQLHPSVPGIGVAPHKASIKRNPTG